MEVVSKWADVEKHFWPLTPAEEKLKAACASGRECVLGERETPPPYGPPSPHRCVRAPILRYFIRGGCDNCKVTGPGVLLFGAHVVDELNLDFTEAKGSTELRNCFFQRRIRALQSRFNRLELSGSTFPGILADGIKVAGHILIRSAISVGDVRISNAEIGGQLSVIGSDFRTNANLSLNLSGTRINGGLFLHAATKAEQEKVKIDGSPFFSDGAINLFRATIGALYAEDVTIIAREEMTLPGAGTGKASNIKAASQILIETKALRAGQLTVEGPVKLSDATIEGEIDFEGARIRGNLQIEDTTIGNAFGHAFNGKRMQVDQAFIWKGVKHREGEVNLTGAQVSELDDDPKKWPGKNVFLMDGFRYQRIKGAVSISQERSDWLERGCYFDNDFRPQPFTQYAAFLRATGHDVDARRVLSRREHLMRAFERAKMTGARKRAQEWLDWLLDEVIGYGHHPFRSIKVLLILIFLTMIPARAAWFYGDMAPNSAPILVSDKWKELAEKPKEVVWNPAEEWGKSVPGKDWETFSTLAYAADVVIPIISFGQTDAWAPSTERSWAGWILWWWRWIFTLAGWIVTALGAAAITGYVSRE